MKLTPQYVKKCHWLFVFKQRLSFGNDSLTLYHVLPSQGRSLSAPFWNKQTKKQSARFRRRTGEIVSISIMEVFVICFAPLGLSFAIKMKWATQTKLIIIARRCVCLTRPNPHFFFFFFFFPPFLMHHLSAFAAISLKIERSALKTGPLWQGDKWRQ